MHDLLVHLAPRDNIVISVIYSSVFDSYSLSGVVSLRIRMADRLQVRKKRIRIMCEILTAFSQFAMIV